MIKPIQQRFFWMSLFGHLLCCVSITWLTLYEPKSIENPAQYMPAYLYQPPRLQPVITKNLPQKPTSKNGIEKKSIEQHLQPQAKLSNPPPKTATTHSTPRWAEQTYTSEKNIAKPLLKLLHDSTAEHLSYPAIAIEFKETGLVQVGFLLSPTGIVSKVVLLKSSGFDPLDNAAITAVEAMSPVRNVEIYLKTPKLLAVDIIFK